MGGQREVIVVDEESETGGETSVAGVSYLDSNGLAGGKCGLKINSVSEADLQSHWTCLLVMNLRNDATILAGTVTIAASKYCTHFHRINELSFKAVD